MGVPRRMAASASSADMKATPLFFSVRLMSSQALGLVGRMPLISSPLVVPASVRRAARTGAAPT